MGSEMARFREVRYDMYNVGGRIGKVDKEKTSIDIGSVMTAAWE